MAETAFACPKCRQVFEIENGTADLTADCPNCTTRLVAHFFSAFFQPHAHGVAAEPLVDATEASCFYHPHKQAVGICDGCGRLICSLCSIDLGSQHLCPNCVSSGKKKGRLTTLETGRTRYDKIALTVAVLGCFLSIFSFFLAPVAIYFSIRHWNSPRSLLGGGRSRFVIAIVIAVASLLLWGVIFGAALFSAPAQHHHHHT
jgi:hypothetical protein